jgi:hypothetical protein
MAGWREGDLQENDGKDGERMNKPAMKVMSLSLLAARS